MTVASNFKINSKNGSEKKKWLKIKISSIFTFFLLFSSVAFISANLSEEKKSSLEIGVSNDTPVLIAVGQKMAASLNTSVDPCENFYAYACGGAIASQPKREENSDLTQNSYLSDIQFSIERPLLERMKDILEHYLQKSVNNAQHPAKSVQLVIDMYQECMDMTTRNRRGLEPLKTLMKNILGSEWPAVDDSNLVCSRFKLQNVTSGGLLRTLAQMEAIDVSPLIKFVASRERMVGYFFTPDLQGNFFFNYSENNIDKLNTYRQQMQKLGELFLDSKLVDKNEIKEMINSRFEEVIAFEKSLAMYQKDKSTALKRFNEISLKEFAQKNDNKQINFTFYLNDLAQKFRLPYRFNGSELVTVEDVAYYQKLFDFITTTSSLTLHNFLGFQLAKKFLKNTGSIGREFFSLDQNNHKIKTEIMPLWEDCVKQVKSDAFFRLLLDSLDSPRTQARFLQMADDLKEAFVEKILKNQTNLDWLGKSRQNNLLEKMVTMQIEVGSPEWMSNETILDQAICHLTPNNNVILQKNNYFENFLVMEKHENAIPFWDVFQPSEINKNDWLKPWFVEYINGKLVTKIFSGYLFPPFFHVDPSVPVALNYGLFGVLLSRIIQRPFEIEVYFARKGSKEQKTSFFNRTQCFVEQYGSIIDNETGIKLNGTRTLEENILLNSSLRIAALALELRLMKNSKIMQKLPQMEHFTQQQLFFLYYSQTMCKKISLIEKQRILEQSKFLFNEYNVNVPLANLEHFSAAFNCPVGSKMNPVKKCRLW